MLEKSRIREMMRAERRKVASSVRMAASAAVCARILDREDVKGALAAKQPFAVYFASPQEIDLAPLIEHLWAVGCPVLVPAWRDGTYVLVPYSPETKLVAGPMGIREPDSEGSVLKDLEHVPAVWIVPGLAFTWKGARLGYGGGWYDRLLSAADPSTISLGVAYPFQMVEELPMEAHDIRLSDVVVAEGFA